jgi:tetrapyrrole methylase family protein / MazG family protein
VERSEDSPTPFGEFVRVIAVLRGPDGCPWDKVQTHESLRKNMIEEAYEAVGAIESNDDAELCEELGDVLLQVVLHAQIATDEGRFGIDDVASGITAKIRHRHPHIFGEAQAGTADEVLANWDKIKHAEKSDRGHGTLDGIPQALPALIYAQKISRKAVAVGFEWETLDDVWAKVHEEIDELKATEPGSPEAVDEIGDVLFTVVNLARKQGIDAEMALRQTCEKFRTRWADMEADAGEMERAMSDLTLDEMEALWQKAKQREEER